MAENDELDPGASTQMFQAFVDRQPTEEPQRGPMRAVLVGIAAVVVLIVVVLIALKLLG